MAYHDHIVIEVRGNLVHNSHQEKNMKESLENVEEVSRLLQKALPHCEVSIVSVLPQYREIDDAPQPENDFPYILMDRFANEILQASFYNLTSLYLP